GGTSKTGRLFRQLVFAEAGSLRLYQFAVRALTGFRVPKGGDKRLISSRLAFYLEAKGGHSMARFSTLLNCRLSFWFCLVAVFTSYFIFGNSAPTQAASAPTRVVIGYPSPTPRVAPLWIAQDLDFFGKYGLTAQIVLVRNNQMLTAGMVWGGVGGG